MGTEICDGVIRKHSSPGIEWDTLLRTLWNWCDWKEVYSFVGTDDSDDDEPTVHSLPFRVLGTCYSTSRQEALKRHLSIRMDKTDTSLSNLKHI